jgi:hypothetical protein
MTGLLERSRPRRRRFRFSMNTLAIQVSAFALSFTLVALLVVGSSRAAFVEENETVTERVPVGLPEAAPGPAPAVPGSPAPSRPAEPTPPPAPTELPEPVQQIELTDDSAGTAMFTDDHGLAPGTPEQRCIRVSLDGEVVAEPVVLYAAEVRGALAQYLDLTVEISPDGGAFGDCSGFVPGETLFTGSLADFGADHGGYGTGLASWAPSVPGEARSFRFTVTVRDVPEAEGLSAGFGFTWEARA